MIFVLTPIAAFDTKSLDETFESLPGRLTALAMARPAFYGGWMGATAEPTPTRTFIPAGSVLFFEDSEASANDDQFNSKLEATRANRLGQDTDLGFGEFVYGNWPKR